MVILRCLPVWTHRVLARLLPSYWPGQRTLLGPKVQELLDKNDPGTWVPHDDKPDDLNVLAWLVGLAKGRERNADTLGHVLVLVALAMVHTTLLRMVNVLYDVTDAGPQLRQELLDEMAAVARRGWHDNQHGNPYDALDKLDSVLRESQRLSPPTTMGMKRWFKQAHTLSDGTRVPAGTYACMPVYAVENDPAVVAQPERFDGLRAYRAAREAPGREADFRFSSPAPNFLNFGYGKTACPGRFVAGVVVKMVVVKALGDYEFQFLPGAPRPSNILAHEFLFTWPWTRMLVRKRQKGTCPF